METTVKVYDVDKPKLPFSYWQIAAFGIVPVAVVGVWYYFKSSKKECTSKPKDIGVTTDGSAKVLGEANKTVKSIIKKEENGVKPDIPKTPLQRAKAIKDAGNVFFKESNYTDAIRCYTEAIDLCPTSERNVLATFYQNRAACHDQLNNLADVVKDCSAALKLDPKYTKALTRRAKAYQSLNKLSECLEDITAVCILENFSNQRNLEMADSVLKHLGRHHAKEAMVNRPPIQPSANFVKSYFSSFPNDPVISPSDFEVVEVNSALIASEAGDTSASHLERAKQLLLRGRYDEVVPALSATVCHGEGLEPEALLLRATMYMLRGQHSLALDDLNTIIQSNVQNNKITVNALIKRASLYLQGDDKEKTFEDFDVAEKLDPNIPDLYLHRGQMHLLTDNVELSLKDFKKCVELDPTSAIGVMQGHYAQYRQAVQQGSMSGIAKVIEKFKRDIRKFPKCSEGPVLLAQVLMDQQQFDDADMYFENAMKLDPTNATLYVHRGLLQLQWKGDIDSAVTMINNGIKVDDRCSFCYETLGTIEVQRGNLRNAVVQFNKAIPLAKNEGELSHILSLRDAAEAQQVVAERLGLSGLIGA